MLQSQAPTQNIDINSFQNKKSSLTKRFNYLKYGKPQTLTRIREYLKYGGPDFYSEEYNEEEAVEFQRVIEIYLEEQATYWIEISFLLKAKTSFFSLYHNQKYQNSLIPKSCLVSPDPNNFVPFKFSFPLNTKVSRQKSHSFDIYNAYDKPCELKNVVLTAKKS